MYITAPMYTVYPSHYLSRAPWAEDNLQTYKMQDRTPGGGQACTRVWHQSKVERNLLNSSKNLARDTQHPAWEGGK